MHVVAVAIMLAAFFFWTWMLVRVHREFERTSNQQAPMTLTFYTLGITGPLLLLGRRCKDAKLAQWVEDMVGEELDGALSPSESFTTSPEYAAFEQEEPERQSLPVRVTGTRGEGGLAAAKVILHEAVRQRATDVHLEPAPGQLSVRYRVDGILQTSGAYPKGMTASIISALKVLGRMDIADKRRPQEGSFSDTLAGRPVDCRVSTAGTSHGEKMVIRILDRRIGLRKLQALGFRRSMYGELHSLVARQHGMLVVCGPTGSGKSTTLYAALLEVDRQALNVITIENPTEYTLLNVTQHNVNEKADITFASLLRSALHQDPDILMIGEMRDTETAEVAMQAAMTGHFVYTTVHAGDTVSALYRLLDLGVEPYSVASSLTAILAQRLMRRLCRACREGHKPTAEERRELGRPAEQVEALYAPKGCDRCRGTGYLGRVGVFELLVLTDEIRSLLHDRASLVDVKKAARKAGVVPLRVDALAKAVVGISSVAEAIRVTG